MKVMISSISRLPPNTNYMAEQVVIIFTLMSPITHIISLHKHTTILNEIIVPPSYDLYSQDVDKYFRIFIGRSKLTKCSSTIFFSIIALETNIIPFLSSV